MFDVLIFTPGRKHNPIDGVGTWCDVTHYLSRCYGCACSTVMVIECECVRLADVDDIGVGNGAM